MNLRGILTSFCFDPTAEVFLRLNCRTLGLFSWPLTKLRLADTGSLSITRECLDYRSSSLKSFSSCAIPLANITSVSGGAHKPWSFLVAAGIFGLLTVISLATGYPIHALLLLVAAGISALQYIMQQSFFIRIEHGDDNVFCITLHPGLIEGIVVQAAQVEAVCDHIRAAMLEYTE